MMDLNQSDENFKMSVWFIRGRKWGGERAWRGGRPMGIWLQRSTNEISVQNQLFSPDPRGEDQVKTTNFVHQAQWSMWALGDFWVNHPEGVRKKSGFRRCFPGELERARKQPLAPAADCSHKMMLNAQCACVCDTKTFFELKKP